MNMKKLVALLLALVMVFALCACGSKDAQDTDKKDDGNKTAMKADDIPDEMTSSDGKYQIAFVTDVGSLKDKSFNQGTYDGVKLYANANSKSYKYYQPANGDKATDDDRYDAMKAAVDNGAEVVVAAGFLQGAALEKAAKEFTDTKFVFIDGSPIDGVTNLAAISFREEQCGYLAGYAAVMEGYTKRGFCGGSIFDSITAAASANDAAVIGVDVDQSYTSDTVITSALKGIGAAAQQALTAAYGSDWANYGGKLTTLGAAEGAVGLPTDTWSLKNWTVDQYNAMFEKIVKGEISIDNDFSKLASTDHVTLNLVK